MQRISGTEHKGVRKTWEQEKDAHIKNQKEMKDGFEILILTESIQGRRA